MWKTIENNSDVSEFMEKVCRFHDSCIKETSYISGAYVNADRSMHPLNDRRILRVLIQRQSESDPVTELEFSGLKCLKLFPVDECYTCEISDSSMIIKDGCVCWGDCDSLQEFDFDSCDGVFVCAEKLRWRSVENQLGEKEFYRSEV